jgi:hypothetical protein
MNNLNVPSGSPTTVMNNLKVRSSRLTKGLNQSSVLRLIQSAAMFSGFLLLAVEIRMEHRAVLVDDWHAWIPIVFCLLMLLAIPLGTVFWRYGGSKVLVGRYFLTACLGVLGLALHSEGHLMQRLIEVLSLWWSSVQSGSEIEAHHPPLLAPAAFMGLGFIGILFVLTNKPNNHEKLSK